MTLRRTTQTALAAALSGLALLASAMTAIQDVDLNEVSGQDGVSIAVEQKDSVKFTDKDATGGSITLNDIQIQGTLSPIPDVIHSAAFVTAAMGAGSILGFAVAADFASMSAGQQAIMLLGGQAGTIAAFMPTGDVIQIAVPRDGTRAQLLAFHDATGYIVRIAGPKTAAGAGYQVDVKVGSITMGNSTASYGSLALNEVKMAGTTVYVWLH